MCSSTQRTALILSAKTISELGILTPCLEKYKVSGVSGGLSYCGYDIALKQSLEISSGGFVLGSSVERFKMPLDVVGTQHDKSTWARKGIAVQATVVEPGWEGWLTIEISNHGPTTVEIPAGTPIAQILFHKIDVATEGYSGKYQNQKDAPQEAILDQETDLSRPSDSGTTGAGRASTQFELYMAYLSGVATVPGSSRGTADHSPYETEFKRN